MANDRSCTLDADAPYLFMVLILLSAKYVMSFSVYGLVAVAELPAYLDDDFSLDIRS